MPVIPSRYTCPLFSPNVVAPRKALQAEASEASEVRIKTLQREDTQCNGSRDVCCYFFGGKTETKAIGSFIISPRINHQFSAWSSKASWSHGHGAWHAMTLANQELADTDWAIMGHPEIYHGHGSHLPLFGSSLFVLVIWSHFFNFKNVYCYQLWSFGVAGETKTNLAALCLLSITIWRYGQSGANSPPPNTSFTAPWRKMVSVTFCPFLKCQQPRRPMLPCKGYELVSAKEVPILVTCSAIKGLKKRSANCCQTNMLCTLKAMRDTS